MKTNQTDQIPFIGTVDEELPNKAQHSPLPWNIGEDNDVFSANTDCVARVCGAPEGIKGDLANAKLIVRAVNNADKLAEEVRSLIERLEALGETAYASEAALTAYESEAQP